MGFVEGVAPSVAESQSAPTLAEAAGVGPQPAATPARPRVQLLLPRPSSSPACGLAAGGCAAAGCCRAARRTWNLSVWNKANSFGLGLRPATGSSDAAPLEGCARVPPSAIERARVSVRFDLVKQPRGVRCTDGTLMLSWVTSDAFGSGIRRALGTAAPTICTFAAGLAADGCRAAGPRGAGALPPDRVPCIVSKYSPTALDSPQTGHYV
jgi:hypothetical protein